MVVGGVFHCISTSYKILILPCPLPFISSTSKTFPFAGFRLFAAIPPLVKPLVAELLFKVWCLGAQYQANAKIQ